MLSVLYFWASGLRLDVADACSDERDLYASEAREMHRRLIARREPDDLYQAASHHAISPARDRLSWLAK
jgi:hypothetical protein